MVFWVTLGIGIVSGTGVLASQQHEMFGLHGRRAFVWRTVVAALGLADFFAGRAVIFSDGISYLEIARNYAAGNWNLAVNAYWSPLYSWLLALWRLALNAALALLPASTAAERERILRLDNRLEVLGLHVVNLAAYFAAWIVFERLLARVDQSVTWRSEESRSAFLFASCYGFLCFALYGVGTDFPSPDMIVLALFLWATDVLLGLRADPIRWKGLTRLGLIVAAAYLTKTAMLPAGLLLIACAVWIAEGSRVGGALVALAPVVVLSVPWILMISAHAGHWTIGDSGKLNYAWEVAGAQRYIHWQGVPADLGTPRHATRRLLEDPPVYEFGSPIPATYAPWYDPAYWYDGIAPKIRAGPLLDNVWVNLRYALFLLVLTPGLLTAGIAAAICRQWQPANRSLQRYWFILLPSAGTILLYCPVFVDKRYLAGALIAIVTVMFAAFLSGIGGKMVADLVRIHTVAVGFFLLSPAVIIVLHSIVPAKERPFSTQLEIAAEMRQLGLSAGDRIGYVGMAVNAAWAACDRVRIVSEVPVLHGKSDSVVRRGLFETKDTDRFWLGDASRREEAMTAMKSAGARAVAADCIPKGADLSGWHVLSTEEPCTEERTQMAIRFLDR